MAKLLSIRFNRNKFFIFQGLIAVQELNYLFWANVKRWCSICTLNDILFTFL